jgi:RNA polymerase sigma-70 factor (ECF subfamily)
VNADSVYVRRVLEGDTSAFQALVLRYSGAVFALVFTHLGRSSDAEDVAQEVFLQAFRSLPKLKNHEKFGCWIYGIARHVCMNWLRQRRSVEISLAEIPDTRETSDTRFGEGASGSKGREEFVLDCVQSLPLIYREVVNLRYMEDCTYSEIAEILGISESAVNVRLIKARRMLREQLEKVSG